MATAELAVAMPAVVLALGMVIAVGQAVVAKIGCVDAARAGARAASRGDDDGSVRALARQASGGPVQVQVAHGDLATVTVTRRLGLGRVLPSLRIRCVAASSVEQRDGGSASILLLAAVWLAITAAGSLAYLGSAVIARHRAESAADLAALAAAEVLLGRSDGEPCQAARRVASWGGGTVTSCRTGFAAAAVEVTVPAAGPVRRLGPARARAVAGPAADPAGSPRPWRGPGWSLAKGQPRVSRSPPGSSLGRPAPEADAPRVVPAAAESGAASCAVDSSSRVDTLVCSGPGVLADRCSISRNRRSSRPWDILRRTPNPRSQLPARASSIDSAPAVKTHQTLVVYWPVNSSKVTAGELSPTATPTATATAMTIRMMPRAITVTSVRPSARCAPGRPRP
jgi:secretion/DNA translocation related TadE-like protein